MQDEAKYRLEKRTGIAAVVIHERKILLLKRLPLPIVTNPGIWSFVFGGRKKGERYLDAAYREIDEETGIGKTDLKLLGKAEAELFDRRRNRRWKNHLFVFRSATSMVRKSLENSAYRWAPVSDIREREDYTNIFIGEEKILRMIERHVNGG